MKYYSITDAYGLGLIAKNPRRDWRRVKENLSEDARKIADELTEPGHHASREVRTAAKDLLDRAAKVSRRPTDLA